LLRRISEAAARESLEAWFAATHGRNPESGAFARRLWRVHARHEERDEKALVPERNPYMWWLGRSPNHHIYGSLLRARGIFITLRGVQYAGLLCDL